MIHVVLFRGRILVSVEKIKIQKKRRNYFLFKIQRNHVRECLPECELIQYTIQSSYANYPSVKAFNKTLQRVKIIFVLIEKYKRL